MKQRAAQSTHISYIQIPTMESPLYVKDILRSTRLLSYQQYVNVIDVSLRS